jgi:hypothetical protein
MVGTEIACNMNRGVVMFFESLVAGSLRLGTHGVVAASMGLHVVPRADLPLGIPKVLQDSRLETMNLFGLRHV